jgi:uncharacterized protein YndB with AHSA1/START domain
VIFDGRKASFEVRHTLAGPPEELWRWLTEPALLARWSLARVVMDEPFALGSQRAVTIQLGPLPVQHLREQITWVDRPRAFRYRGLDVAGHEGELSLLPHGARTELVHRARFEAPHALLARPLARFVCMQLNQSYARLSRLLTSAQSSDRASL